MSFCKSNVPPNTPIIILVSKTLYEPGADPGFQVRGGGAHLKQMRRAEGGAKLFGVFRVKNHDFTPKNHIFSNFRGARAPGARPPPPPPWIRPCERYNFTYLLVRELRKQVTLNECHLNIFYSIFYCNVAKPLENEI